MSTYCVCFCFISCEVRYYDLIPKGQIQWLFSTKSFHKQLFHDYKKDFFSVPLQSLLEAHDIVASKCYDSPPSSPEVNNSSVNNQVVPVDAIRILGIHKRAGEPLVSNGG